MKKLSDLKHSKHDFGIYNRILRFLLFSKIVLGIPQLSFKNNMAYEPYLVLSSYTLHTFLDRHLMVKPERQMRWYFMYLMADSKRTVTLILPYSTFTSLIILYAGLSCRI